MAFDQAITGGDYTLAAAADLSAKQYFCVSVDSNGKAALAGVGADIAGILQNKPKSGEAAAIRSDGISKGVASGVIAAGDQVASDAAGKLKVATLGAVSASNVIGKALQAAAADGDIIAVKLTRGGAAPSTPA